MEHHHETPFPFTRGDNEVQDEICRCGHYRTEHSDTVFAFGHGSCDHDGCACRQFTYVGEQFNYRGS